MYSASTRWDVPMLFILISDISIPMGGISGFPKLLKFNFPKATKNNQITSKPKNGKLVISAPRLLPNCFKYN